jgi:hypothetical protein
MLKILSPPTLLSLFSLPGIYKELDNQCYQILFLYNLTSTQKQSRFSYW